MDHPFRQRVGELRKLMRRAECACLLVSHAPNIYYLTGFYGSAGYALVEHGRTTLVVDGRYGVQAKEQAVGCEVEVTPASLLEAVGERLRGTVGRRRVGFEAARLTVAQKALLSRRCGRSVTWVSTNGWVEGLRMVKSDSERKRMEAAAAVGCRVFGEVVELVRPEVREVELAAEIEYRLRRTGAAAAFETIVASGPRSALPHARPTTRKLRQNELVVIDMGAILGHYCSDLTRTIYLGRPAEAVRKRRQAVREAHDAAVAVLRPGITGDQVDEAARKVLRRYGVEGQFTHSCGHGLGLEVHEEPRLARGSKAALRPGNVITIEPGVYLEGAGGIRIEDDYIITHRGAERLTRTCRDIFAL